MRHIIHVRLADGQIRRLTSAMSLGAFRRLNNLHLWINLLNPKRGNDALEKHRSRAVMVNLDRARPSKPRLILANSSKATAKSTQASNEYKLHLVMDRDSYAKLGWLKASLEATTDGEVIRRALKAYEVLEPSDAIGDVSKGPNLGHFYPEKDVEHVYIRLPARMKERLDYERETFGRSYGEQVRQALRVLMQLAREREKMLDQIAKKGGFSYDNDSKDRYASDCSSVFDTEQLQRLAVLC